MLNLTLVDLPGTTKVPVGDQPADIEQQIRDMSRQYIKNPNAIILAVTPANTDLANSDALKLAREVDPEGHRTIGIVTKIDMMDRGTDAVDILQGHVIPLHRGFVGVVNRSQADIKARISIEEAQRKEMHFFESHPAYRAMQQVGSKYLSRTLNHMLVHHIRQCLPEIKNRIHAMLTELSAELKSMGKSTDKLNQFDLGGSLLSILSQYSDNFVDALDGRAVGDMSVRELYGGARISFICHEIFAKSLLAMDPFEGGLAATRHSTSIPLAS
jgi:replication fork clamp-binding protein CrfC